jgi:HD superfamily phosphohydrolase
MLDSATHLDAREFPKHLLSRDEIHGDIRLDKLAVKLLDTPPLQRLGRVYQLGYSHLVYRGGNHTRLSHVIGAYEMAGRLTDALQRNYSSPARLHPRGAVEPGEFLPRGATADAREADRWLVLRFLVTWAALLHDVAHVPVGHTLEDEFDKIYEKHDRFTSPRIPYLWYEPTPGRHAPIRAVLLQADLYDPVFQRVGISAESAWRTVMFICLHKEKDNKEEGLQHFRKVLETSGVPFATNVMLPGLDEVEDKVFHPYMADIVGNTICADYLDYLRRDAQNLGLDVLRDDRVISHFWIARENLRSGHSHLRMALSLNDVRGKPRLDTTTGVVDLVRQRYRFAEIVYYHKSKAAASAMLAKSIQLIGKPDECPTHGGRFVERRMVAIDDINARVEKAIRAKNKHEILQELESACLPNSLLDPEVGDESLHLLLIHRAWSAFKAAVEKKEEAEAKRQLRGISLLQHIVNRELYKVCFTMDRPLYTKLAPGSEEDDVVEDNLRRLIDELRGDSNRRMHIEDDLAQAAGFHEDAFILYVPPLKSQAKGIETRALENGSVTTLEKHSAVSEQVIELSRKYKALWRLILFVHPAYRSNPLGLSKALDRLAELLFVEGEPDYQRRLEFWPNLASGAWFDYVLSGDRASTKIYLEQYLPLVPLESDLRYVAFARRSLEGNPSDEEQAQRALLLALADPSREFSQTTLDRVRARFGSAGALTQRVREEVSAGALELEFREGGEGGEIVQAIQRIAADLGAQ